MTKADLVENVYLKTGFSKNAVISCSHGIWDAFYDFRKRQRHARLYYIPFPSPGLPEAHFHDLTSSPAPSREHSIAAQNRHELPLAA